jgi:hypothetical protein
VFDAGGRAGKKHPLEAPVGEKKQLPAPGRLVGEYVLKRAPLDQKGLHPAKAAGEQPVGLFQDDRRPALGALVFDEKMNRIVPSENMAFLS